MKFKLKNEWLNILVILSPTLYLLSVWNGLPEVVPTHWNHRGEVEDFGSKQMLWLLAFVFPVGAYISFFIVPSLDPKKKLHLMGEKLYRMKFLTTALFSALAIYIIHATQTTELNSEIGFSIMGVMFLVLGNFLPSIKPNYFLGIRVPWTLHNEYNWRKTHQMAGKFWMFGGLFILILSLYSPTSFSIGTLFVTIILLSIVPALYSFWLFKTGRDVLINNE